MAQIETGGGDGKKGKTRQKKMQVHVDFTPMVDMNMLLITFFMLCTTMIKSQTLQISLPTNEKVDQAEQNKVKQSEAITIIVDSERDEPDGTKPGRVKKNYVYYYEGKPGGEIGLVDNDGNGLLDNNNLKEIEFLGNANGKAQGIRAILRDRNKQVVEKVDKLKEEWRAKKITDEQYQETAKQYRNDSTLKRPTVIIKATAAASYETLVNALDEMQINSITKYQIDNLNASDSALLLDYLKAHPRK